MLCQVEIEKNTSNSAANTSNAAADSRKSYAILEDLQRTSKNIEQNLFKSAVHLEHIEQTSNR